MAFHQTSTSSSQPQLSKTSILGVLFFLMGAPHVYAFFNPPLQDRGSVGMPKLLTLVVTAGVLASLVEWLMLKGTGIA